jgi:hypothetical protein
MHTVSVAYPAGFGVEASPDIRGIADLASSLELPDPHIYLDDGMTPAQGWIELERLVTQAHATAQNTSL